MQFYRNHYNYIQLEIQIPYSIPEGYSLRLKLTSATFYAGTAYIYINSLVYTPTYDYSISSYYLVISNMGPIVVGTSLKLTVMVYIQNNPTWRVETFIDTPAILSAFSSSSYLYQGLVDGSNIDDDNFFEHWYDNYIGWVDRVISTPTFDNRWFYLRILNYISATATSAGAYVEFYLSPLVEVSPTFDPNSDCRFHSTSSTYMGSCNIVFVKTANYLKITIKATGSYAVSNPNPFPHNTRRYIYLRNMVYPKSSSNKVIYPIYMTLYKSDVVNPTAYRRMRVTCAVPRENMLSGMALEYIGNYATSSSANYQTYPGALRF